MTTRDDLTDVARRLILRAAHKAPPALAERLEEEWLADLQSRSGSLSRLRLAIGCWWATGVITRECRVPQLAAAGAHRPLLGDLRPDLPLLSRRTVAFMVIAAVHALLIYAFTTGLAQHVVASIPELTHAVFLDQINPEHPLPPPPQFKPVAIQPVRVDPVVPQTIDSVPDQRATEQSPVPAAQNPTRPLTPPTPSRAWGGPGEGFPTTDEYYPAASRRLAEVGAATVGVCVDPQGRLTAEPTLVATSGSRRLDAGALTLAKAGSGHYRPTTDDGQAVTACYAYRIRFKLG